MKATRKLLAMLLVAAMVFSLGATAVFADDTTPTGSITIDNATIGETYTIYKLFDATYGNTYTDSNGNTVTPTAYIATAEQYATLSADENCVFAFTPIYDKDGEVSGYQVTVGTTTETGEDGKTTTRSYTDDEVIAYIKSLIFSVKGFPGVNENAGQETATSDTVQFTNLEFGYYYVTSTLGATVSINTVNPDATIEDKNSPPPSLDNDPDPNEPDKDVVNESEDSIDGTVVSVGDTLTYVISWENAGYYTEAKDGTMASVVVTDTTPKGTAYVAESAKIVIYDADGNQINSGDTVYIEAEGLANFAKGETYYTKIFTEVDSGAEFNSNTTYYTENDDGGYTEATGLDAFAENTTYYTAEFVAVASDATFDSSATYYTAKTITAVVATAVTYSKATNLSGFADDETYYTEDNGTYTEVTSNTTFNSKATYYTALTTVTWTVTNLPQDYSIEASFGVTVLSTALDNDQNKVENTASLALNNTFNLTTNTVTNYVPDDGDPVKDVKTVDNGAVGTVSANGEKVKVNDVLQYEITYQNYVESGGTGSAQEVVIVDAAPTGTVYVADSAALTITDDTDETSNDVEITWNDDHTDGTFTVGEGENATTYNVSIEINSNGDITWTVDKLPVNYTVTATFQVTVTEAAYGITDQTVRNTAEVTLDTNPAITTNEVYNPLEENPDYPYDPEPGKVIVEDDGTETQTSTGSFGDTVTFDLGIDAVNKVSTNVDSDDDGIADTEQVTEYYIYDKMDPGFDLTGLTSLTIGDTVYSGNSITNSEDKSTGITTWTIKSGDTKIATFYTCEVDEDNDGETDYTLIMGTITWATPVYATNVDGNTTQTITGYTSLYPNCEVHLTYTATINTDAVIAANGNLNTFVFSYNTASDTGTSDKPDPENPEYPDAEELVNGSDEKSTTTYTYALAIQKVSKETGEALAGATFTLVDAGGNTIYGVPVKDNDENVLYYNYTSNGSENNATDQFVTNSDGQIIIKGVDIGTYSFTETKAPNGYVLLDDSVPVTATMSSSSTTQTREDWSVTRTFAAITEAEYYTKVSVDGKSFTNDGTLFTKDSDGTYTAVTSGSYDSSTDYYTFGYDGGMYTMTSTTDSETNATTYSFTLVETKPTSYSSNTTYYKLTSETSSETTYKGTTSTVEFDVSVTVLSVKNSTGSELPSTGGMGTTLFYIFGALLVFVAGILLVVKRRMRAE